LVNVHEHLTFKQAGYKLREWLLTVDTLYAVHGVKSALVSLKNGVTTIREMGSRKGISIAIKQAVEAGVIPGPRIIVAGAPLAMTGAHSRRMSRQVDGPDDVRKAAREAFRDGADFLKVFSSCDPVDVGTDELATAEFGPEELRAAVEEAHNRGRKVAAHSVGTKALQSAIGAGVDSIEHGIYMNDALAEQMVQMSTYLVPTVSGYAEMANPTWGWPSEVARLYARLREAHLQSLAIAVKRGVRLAVGSDSNGDMVDELEYLIAAGLSPLQAISAATLMGAQLLGMGDQVGSIEVGKLADFLILDQNPLTDLKALRNISQVVKGGCALAKSDFDILEKAADIQKCQLC
jgi:imidazolonepropionase-like amidohydrolase